MQRFRLTKKQYFLALGSICFLVGIAASVWNMHEHRAALATVTTPLPPPAPTATLPEPEAPEIPAAASEPAPPATTSALPQPKIGIFNGADFKAVFDTMQFENLAALDAAPDITGNPNADAHIRGLAEARGYTRHPMATQWVDIQGFQLQALAAEGWTTLQAAAQAEGIYLQLVAGFRTYDVSQAMFLAALASRGVPTEEIASGAYDQAIDAVLGNNAPPGYSRHQNGYVVDIACGNTPNQSFASTPCNSWLVNNNYWQAKLAGWIPSYPPDGPQQGPNPEAWEYIWVGQSTLLR